MFGEKKTEREREREMGEKVLWKDIGKLVPEWDIGTGEGQRWTQRERQIETETFNAPHVTQA